jgi:Ca-activated chloride channel family protein
MNPLFQTELTQPYWLLGLIGVLWWIYDHYWRSRKKNRNTTLAISHIGSSNLPSTWRVRLLPYLPLLPVTALVCVLIALARPRLPLQDETIKADGIDIILAMDVSVSMLARDFSPNRLEAAKKVASDFVLRRKNDRIGLVVFSGESFTQCPLTFDHEIVSQNITSIQTGLLEPGTAIGMGLSAAVNRLKYSQAKSRIIILVTDGVNNSGEIDPQTAIELSSNLGIKVYTIGIGTIGYVEAPDAVDVFGNYRYNYVPMELDEALLQDIAAKTGGKYYRAVDVTSLESIYGEIDQLEKSEIETNILRSYKYMFRPWLYAALGLILFWWVIRLFYFTQAFEE